jgi:hypothetical protein
MVALAVVLVATLLGRMQRLVLVLQIRDLVAEPTLIQWEVVAVALVKLVATLLLRLEVTVVTESLATLLELPS